jgi:hypothetical protein
MKRIVLREARRRSHRILLDGRRRRDISYSISKSREELIERKVEVPVGSICLGMWWSRLLGRLVGPVVRWILIARDEDYRRCGQCLAHTLLVSAVYHPVREEIIQHKYLEIKEPSAVWLNVNED